LGSTQIMRHNVVIKDEKPILVKKDQLQVHDPNKLGHYLNEDSSPDMVPQQSNDQDVKTPYPSTKATRASLDMAVVAQENGHVIISDEM